MVNTVDFTNRLKKILQHHQLTASQFADQVGVQRSSISHILSGRNKPSLDFILKVTNKFTDVDIYWLLNGKGTFPKESQKEVTTTPSPSTLFSTPEISSPKSASKQIHKIVVFYTDGTFDEYHK
jgi:transcriptional regulator with XRE-family HTH domain